MLFRNKKKKITLAIQHPNIINKKSRLHWCLRRLIKIKEAFYSNMHFYLLKYLGLIRVYKRTFVGMAETRVSRAF